MKNNWKKNEKYRQIKIVETSAKHISFLRGTRMAKSMKDRNNTGSEFRLELWQQKEKKRFHP